MKNQLLIYLPAFSQLMLVFDLIELSFKGGVTALFIVIGRLKSLQPFQPSAQQKLYLNEQD